VALVTMKIRYFEGTDALYIELREGIHAPKIP